MPQGVVVVLRDRMTEARAERERGVVEATPPALVGRS